MPAVTFERVDNKDEIVLSASIKSRSLRPWKGCVYEVAARMPRAELPEIILEIAVRTGFAEAFTHINDRNTRAEDIMISLCAVSLGRGYEHGHGAARARRHPGLAA